MAAPLLDRLLLPLRLARARARESFHPEDRLGQPLYVEEFDLGFPHGEAAYNAMGQAADGTIWFAVSTKCLEAGARLFALEPGASSPRTVADLDDAFATEGIRAIPQGKVHVDLIPFGEAMLGATHIGYYDPRARVERPGAARGYAPYAGGWFFAIEPDRIEPGRIVPGRIVPLAQAPAGEGIVTMSADVQRRRLFALTWPGGLLLSLDLDTRLLRNHGPAMGAGETGSRRDGSWSRICRSLAVDPATGTVFWSDDAGRVSRFDGSSMEVVSSTPGGEMWRKMLWHPATRAFYGLLRLSSTLVRFDPATLLCEKIGTLDMYGTPATLAFTFDPDAAALHALVAGPGVLRDRQLQLAGSVSYVTFDLSTGRMRDSGPLRLADGRWITQSQSLLVSGGTAYALCWVEVPRGDRSARARELRRLRRHTPEYRTRGYAEEMMLVRFPRTVSPRREGA
jgi:hypothetical protein